MPENKRDRQEIDRQRLDKEFKIKCNEMVKSIQKRERMRLKEGKN